MSTNCHKEILDLHQFFESWMMGQEADFSRFEKVLAQEFEIITPDGSRVDREGLLPVIRDQRGALEPNEFKIWIEDFQARLLSSGLWLATYEEWQTRGKETKGRLSSAILREESGRPNLVEWVHVHETWLC